MEEREFIKPVSLLRKFYPKGTREEKKKSRKVLFWVFLISVILVGLPLVYREIPNVLNKLGQSKVAVTQKFEDRIPSPTPTPAFEKEKEAVEGILVPLRGRYGIYFQDLNSKQGFNINGAEKFTAASLMKLPVMLALYRQAEAKEINLDLVYHLQAGDKRGGAGSLGGRPVGFEISYRKMAELMGQQSDNTAYNILSRILGKTRIQTTIDLLGMKNTSYEEGMTTPEDMAIFFDILYKSDLISEKSREEILSFLTNTIWEDRIPVGVPKEIRVSHKIGTEVGVINDAGIIFAPKPYILVIMSEEANEIEAKKALPEISKRIYEQVED